MKASETRELIEISISMAFGNTKRDNKKLHELCQLAHVELDELERLAEIGRATEFAMQDGSKHTVFAKGIDYLLEFYYRESEE